MVSLLLFARPNGLRKNVGSLVGGWVVDEWVLLLLVLLARLFVVVDVGRVKIYTTCWKAHYKHECILLGLLCLRLIVLLSMK
jgi:hypothetical protein